MKVKTICTTRRAKIVIPVLWLAGIMVGLPSGLYHVGFEWILIESVVFMLSFNP